MLPGFRQPAAIAQRRPTSGDDAKDGLKPLGKLLHPKSLDYAESIPNGLHHSLHPLNLTRRIPTMRRAIILLFLTVSVSPIVSAQQPLEAASPIAQTPVPGSAGTNLNWESQARLHRTFRGKPGRLTLGPSGVEFRPSNGPLLHWPFEEIETFDLLNPRHLVITGYENRSWHRHGDRKFRFDLDTPMPPGVAAEFARSVGKPVRNGDPNPTALAFATVPARHRTLCGGTNGVLRFSADGIEYVTPTGRRARNWRWSDIDTLANPDPYHFTVTGYRETFEFQLKEPMSNVLFNRVWDHLYARDRKSVV